MPAIGRLLGALLIVVVALVAAPTSAPAASEAEEPAQAGYLKLHPDFIVNLRSAGKPRILLATVQVMSRDAVTLEGASHHLPALRHQMLLLLGEQVYPDIRDAEAQRALQGVALEALNGVLASEMGSSHALEGVYFTNFIIE